MQGLVGLVGDQNVVADIYTATVALGHRGQLYGGVACADGEGIVINTHRGIFADTFRNNPDQLGGCLGIGVTSGHDRQPIYRESKLGQFVIGFDGQVKNRNELQMNLFSRGYLLSSPEDVEIAASFVGAGYSFEEGLNVILRKVVGPVAIVVLTETAIYAARGITYPFPLVIGHKEGCRGVMSETCALDSIGMKLERDVYPGEILKISPENGIETIERLGGNVRLCACQWFTAGHPSSVIDGINVGEAREAVKAVLGRDGLAPAQDCPWRNADYDGKSVSPGGSKAPYSQPEGLVDSVARAIGLTATDICAACL